MQTRVSSPVTWIRALTRKLNVATLHHPQTGDPMLLMLMLTVNINYAATLHHPQTGDPMLLMLTVNITFQINQTGIAALVLVLFGSSDTF
jgi:hypothetical protein